MLAWGVTEVVLVEESVALGDRKLLENMTNNTIGINTVIFKDIRNSPIFFIIDNRARYSIYSHRMEFLFFLKRRRRQITTAILSAISPTAASMMARRSKLVS